MWDDFILLFVVSRKEMAGNSRSLEDVLKAIELAKLSEKDLERSSQAIWLSGNLGSENVKLLEINNKLIEHLNEGKNLVIRGCEADFAVLCTDNETYEIKDAETSNSMLLLPKFNLPIQKVDEGDRELHDCDVVEIHRTYLELRPCNPKLKKLKELLLENPYRGREYELNNENVKFTIDDLLEVVQCSENQLRKALVVMKACEIDGFWRVLEFDYEYRVVSMILDLVDEYFWSLTELPIATIFDVLEGLAPRPILKHCLELYADETKDGIYCLKEKETCCLFAEVLLRVTGKFNLDEFFEAWKSSVPDGFMPNFDFLKGIALIDQRSQLKVISYFSKYELPDDIIDRFKVLFNQKEKWSFDEIEPYIKDLTTEKLDANALLMKHTRSFQINGSRYFNSK